MFALRFRAALAALASLSVLFACTQQPPPPMTTPDAGVLSAYALGTAVAGYASFSQEISEFDTEQYDFVREGGFLSPLHHPLSTFSIDVDTASYSNVRRLLRAGSLPPKGAVRIEEMLNYFSYD